MSNLNASALKFLPVAVILVSISILLVTRPIFAQTDVPHVTNFHANDVDAGSVTLSWDVPTAPTGQTLSEVRIYRRLSSDTGRGDLLIILSHDSASTSTTASYVDATATPNTSYTYNIQAVYAGGGTTHLSDYVALTVATPDVPHVTNFHADDVAHRSVTLSWDVPTAPTGQTLSEVRIYRRLSSDTGRGDHLVTLSHDSASTTTTASYADATAEPNTSYTYNIQAVYAGGGTTHLSYYNDLTVTTMLAAPHVTNFQADDVEPWSVTLGWDVPTAPTGQTLSEVRIYRRLSSDTGRGDLLIILSHDSASTSTTASYADATAEPDTSYTYNIQAVYAGGGTTHLSLYVPLTVTTQVAPINMTNFQADDVAHRSVSLSWDIPTAPTGRTPSEYRIYRAESGDTSRGDHLVTLSHDSASTSTTLSYTDTTATPNTWYAYRIQTAYAGDGTTYFSRHHLLQLTTMLARPPVTNLRADDVAHRSVTFSWDIPTAPTGQTLSEYTVHRRDRTNGSPRTLLVTLSHDSASTSTTVSYTDATVEPNTRYKYLVRAIYNDSGRSGSVELDVRTMFAAPSVTNFHANDVDAGSVTLSWDVPTAPTGQTLSEVRIYRRLSSDTGRGDLLIILSHDSASTSTTASYVDATATPNTSYTYNIQAVYAGGGTTHLSVYAPLAVTTQVVPHVTNFHANDVDAGSVTLSWDVPTAPTGQTLREVRIYRRLSSDTGRGDHIVTLSHDSASTSTTASYADATVEPNTSYTYNIQAVYAGGGTTRLSLYAPLTVTTQVLPHVTNFHADDVAHRSVSLGWDVPTAPTGQTLREVRIYRRLSSDTGRGDLLIILSHDSASTSTTASYADATVEPDTSYTYNIQAVYAGAEQPASASTPL